MASLADQLKKLSTPVTKAFEVDIKKRKSLLHSEKDAAKIDTLTCYEMALNQFRNLCFLEPDLKEVEEALYGPQSTSIESCMLTKESREEINKHISKCLILVSAHLTLPGTLTALEWLVYRFEIHLYNVEDLLLCVFPYHDTHLFPKVLQTLDLDSTSNEAWSWLKPLAEKGLPLTKELWVKMSSKDMGLISFLCDCVRKAIKYIGKDDTRLRIPLTFFMQTLVGIFLEPLSEVQLGLVVTHVQDTLWRGLRSSCRSYRATVYAVLQCVAHKLRLHPDLVTRWIGRMLKYPVEGLESETFALIHIFLLTQEMSLREEFVADCRQLEAHTSPEFLALASTMVKQPETSTEADIVIETKEPSIKKKSKMRKSELKIRELVDVAVTLDSPTLEEDVSRLSTMWLVDKDEFWRQLKALKSFDKLVGKDVKEKSFKLSSIAVKVMSRLAPLLQFSASKLRTKALKIMRTMGSKYPSLNFLYDFLDVRKQMVQCDTTTVNQPPYNTCLLQACIPLFEEILHKEEVSDAEKHSMELGLRYLTRDTVHDVFSDERAWNCFERLLTMESLPMLSIVLSRVKPGVFAALPSVKKQIQVVDILLEKIPDMTLACDIFKELPLSAEHFGHLLKSLLPPDVVPVASQKRATPMSSKLDVKRIARLSIVLETLQVACKRLKGIQWDLISLLMQHLETCIPANNHQLDAVLQNESTVIDFEEESSDDEESPSFTVVPTVHRLLGCLLALCENKKQTPAAEGRSIYIDPVLRCVTAFIDQQIVHQSLLIVSHLATMFPFLVVHNLVTLTSLIGRRLLPLDDAHSLGVLARLLDSAIPACLKASPDPVPATVRLMAVFARCRMDIPAHRRLVTYTQLVESLRRCSEKGENLLWAVMVLLVSGVDGAVSEMDSKFLVQLLCAFDLVDQVSAWATVFHFLRYLDKDDKSSDESAEPSPKRRRRSRSTSLSDGSKSAENNSDLSDNPFFIALKLSLMGGSSSDMKPSLYQISITLCSVLEAHLTSPDHVTRLAESAHVSATGSVLVGRLSQLLQEILRFVLRTANRIQSDGRQTEWRPALSAGYRILDKIHRAVPGTQYLSAVESLFTHPLSSVRRRGLELLHSQLTGLTSPGLLGKPLLACVLTVGAMCTEDVAQAARVNEAIAIRRHALACVKDLARLLASEYRPQFKHLVSDVLASMKGGQNWDHESISLALLFCTECVRALGIDLISCVDGLLLKSLDTLEDLLVVEKVKGISQYFNACLTYVGEVARSLSSFLAPHLLRVLRVIFSCGAWPVGLTVDRQNKEGPELKEMGVKVKMIGSALSTSLETRLLLPVVKQLVEDGLQKREWAQVSGALTVFRKHTTSLKGPEDGSLLYSEQSRPVVWSVLVAGLSCRSAALTTSQEEAQALEKIGVRTVCAYLSKLEDSLEQVLAKVMDWSMCDDVILSMDRKISVLSLLDKLAKKIKPEAFSDLARKLGLVQHVTRMIIYEKGDSTNRCNTLLVSVFRVLCSFFAAESTACGCLEASDVTLALIPAIVDVLDADWLPDYDALCADALTPCIGALAECCGGDEALVKPLGHALCLRTKAASANTRMWALKILRTVWERMGEIFITSVLPETLPYLAECLEDDHEDCRIVAKKLYRDLEMVNRH